MSDRLVRCDDCSAPYVLHTDGSICCLECDKAYRDSVTAPKGWRFRQDAGSVRGDVAWR